MKAGILPGHLSIVYRGVVCAQPRQFCVLGVYLVLLDLLSDLFTCERGYYGALEAATPLIPSHRGRTEHWRQQPHWYPVTGDGPSIGGSNITDTQSQGTDGALEAATSLILCRKVRTEAPGGCLLYALQEMLQKYSVLLWFCAFPCFVSQLRSIFLGNLKTDRIGVPNLITIYTTNTINISEYYTTLGDIFTSAVRVIHMYCKFICTQVLFARSKPA